MKKQQQRNSSNCGIMINTMLLMLLLSLCSIMTIPFVVDATIITINNSEDNNNNMNTSSSNIMNNDTKMMTHFMEYNNKMSNTTSTTSTMMKKIYHQNRVRHHHHQRIRRSLGSNNDTTSSCATEWMELQCSDIDYEGKDVDILLGLAMLLSSSTSTFGIMDSNSILVNTTTSKLTSIVDELKDTISDVNTTMITLIMNLTSIMKIAIDNAIEKLETRIESMYNETNDNATDGEDMNSNDNMISLRNMIQNVKSMITISKNVIQTLRNNNPENNNTIRCPPNITDEILSEPNVKSNATTTTTTTTTTTDDKTKSKPEPKEEESKPNDTDDETKTKSKPESKEESKLDNDDDNNIHKQLLSDTKDLKIMTNDLWSETSKDLVLYNNTITKTSNNTDIVGPPDVESNIIIIGGLILLIIGVIVLIIIGLGIIIIALIPVVIIGAAYVFFFLFIFQLITGIFTPGRDRTETTPGTDNSTIYESGVYDDIDENNERHLLLFRHLLNDDSDGFGYYTKTMTLLNEYIESNDAVVGPLYNQLQIMKESTSYNDISCQYQLYLCKKEIE